MNTTPNINRFFYCSIALVIIQVAVITLGKAWSPAVSVLTMTLVTFWHGFIWMGVKRMLFLFLLVSTISWSYETISVLTGFPFGNYHYTDALGAKIGLVPINIMPAYFAVGYFSFVLAHLILDKRNTSYPNGSWLPISIAASFIMVSWDLAMDPIMATVEKNLIWENGGVYFGVPLVNFAGWFLCVFSFYALFTLIYRKPSESIHKLNIVSSRKFWIIAPLSYAALLTGSVRNFINGTDESAFSPDGKEWLINDISGSLLLISCFTLLPIALLASYKIFAKTGEGE
ncbi:carotenoid biosynthesis protein [Zhongshania aliphaticivorans]|nr:carotenoid biosynthesis protein [Zhongshania aliphaticivorans]